MVDGDRPPLLVCSNHLTLVDSMILAWALSPLRGYLLRFSSLPWNVPEKANFSGTLFWNVTAFLGKCVYVTRGGPREEVRHTLLKLAHLLQAGELVSIFPEGGRSRTGRVDTENFGYGVGQLLQAVPGAEVLCVYLRGKQQGGYSDYPERGDEYEVRLERFRPRTEQGGLRGARDLATQVIDKLADMERQYFADRQ
jgi:1-acyl-sn-glycerol-3-phosphate acyltransferase